MISFKKWLEGFKFTMKIHPEDDAEHVFYNKNQMDKKMHPEDDTEHVFYNDKNQTDKDSSVGDDLPTIVQKRKPIDFSGKTTVIRNNQSGKA